MQAVSKGRFDSRKAPEEKQHTAWPVMDDEGVIFARTSLSSSPPHGIRH